MLCKTAKVIKKLLSMGPPAHETGLRMPTGLGEERRDVGGVRVEGADGSVWEVAIGVDRERSVCGGSVEGDWPQVEAEQIYAVELQGEWVQVKYMRGCSP